MDVTIVFQKIWEAVNAKNEDGSRKYRYIILTGSSRSSKTHSILQLHHLQSLTNSWRTSIWRETKKDTKDTVLADFRKVLPNFDGNVSITFNKTESIFTYPNNATIEIAGGDDEVKVHGFQGDVAHFNEPYGISRETFDQIDMRTSEYVIIDWNPRQNHWIEDVARLDSTIVIHSTFRDNPFVPEQQKIKILSYQPLKHADIVVQKLITEENAKKYNCEENVQNFTEKQIKELKRCIYNEKTQTAREYEWLVYGLGLKAENPRKIHHNFKRITLEQYNFIREREYQGLDFGFANPSAFVKMKYDGDRSFYILPLLYKPMNQMPMPLGEALMSVGCIKGNSTIGWADSADREPGSEISLINELRSNYDLNFYPTKKPTYKARFESMSNALFFYVYDEEFEFEVENYQYEYINGQPTEKPIKKNDHYMNAVEYCYWGMKEYLGIMF